MRSLNDLEGFCDYLVKMYGSPRASTEEQKAAEFRKLYLKDLPTNVRALRAVAGCFGICLKELEKMPRNVRGYHEICDGRKYIYYRAKDSASGIENTILHELREMMETVFGQIQPGYEALRTSARHIAANRFASAVLLPEDEFRERVYQTGFDVISLSRIYSKSYSQILLRMGEVFEGRVFFYGALYESDDAEGEEWAVTYWSGSRNGETNPNIFDIDGPFPKKGGRALPGSLVDRAVKTKKPHLSNKITLNRAWRLEGGLIALAQPMVDSAEIEKVAMVVMKASDGHLLKPQIDVLKPVTMEVIPASLGGKDGH
ncbi:protein of unknown function (DUF955) [Dehalogenimonas alkenigignens]|uniref:IrrE N-terminal-like domain-containing protein n=1 Tax=Dehalogenimonas alkenigignens TaxID=1217799 RepID=A0A0W0GH28_9CHLR|nr:ImmA/IrrE family metallo-endopeptidase [Dehalogenimonas alkenigignens]KTB47862.1 protein of unknown function (DUF955) [Dehalogenimonas alkenigignens]